MFKIGDKVLFCKNREEYDFYCGVILDNQDDIFFIVTPEKHVNSIMMVREENIFNYEENIEYIKKLVDIGYFQIIKELADSLKDITDEEKDKEKVEKFNEIKTLILKNCVRIVGDDDDEFERRLKEIYKLKKEIYSIKIEGVEKIRRHNGAIKYKMAKMNEKRDIILNRLERGFTWV